MNKCEQGNLTSWAASTGAAISFTLNQGANQSEVISSARVGHLAKTRTA